MTRTCEQCSKPFETPKAQKRCPSCRRCLVCGKPVKESRVVYCSPKCRGVARRGTQHSTHERVCVKCGRAFQAFAQRHLCPDCRRCAFCGKSHDGPPNRKFCSRRCLGLHSAIVTKHSVQNLVKARASITPESRAKAGDSMRGIGRPHTRGLNSWLWRGGTSPERSILSHREEYRAWRRAVLKRDASTCQGCGRCGGSLHAHHKKQWALYPELRYDVSNGITLCASCHTKETNKEKAEAAAARRSRLSASANL